MIHFKPKKVGKGREREKIKIILPFRSYTKRDRKFQKNSQKVRKTKQYQYGNRREREEIKTVIPFRSVPTLCVIENCKKIAKKFKKLKYTIMASFQAKIG